MNQSWTSALIFLTLAAPLFILLLNSLTFSLTFLQGMRSSVELPGSPQEGQALLLFSASVRAARAHSSQMEHAHIGIMMQSCKKRHFNLPSVCSLFAHKTIAP